MPLESGGGALSPPRARSGPTFEKIAFWLMRLPPVAITPAELNAGVSTVPLNAIVLFVMKLPPTTASTPNSALNSITFCVSVMFPEIATPLTFPMASVPVTSVPMKLSSTIAFGCRTRGPCCRCHRRPRRPRSRRSRCPPQPRSRPR